MVPAKQNPDATMATKALVLYGLLLFSGKRYSLSELAGRLSCSKQTVLRLIEQIETTHALPVHIESELSGNRRFYWAAKAERAPNVTLSEEDIQQLTLCRDIVWHILPESLRNEISQTIQHTTALLPDFGKRANALKTFVSSRPKGVIDYSGHQQILSTLLDALRGSRIVEVDYRSHASADTKRFALAPLRLISFHDALYVKGRLEEALPSGEGYFDPLLAVHRISEAALTERRFVRPDEPEPVAPGPFGLMPGKPFEVRVAISAKAAAYVRERIWSAGQRIDECDDGGLVLSFTAVSREEVIAWVLGFGVNAELLKPEDLRSELMGILRSILVRYGD